MLHETIKILRKVEKKPRENAENPRENTAKFSQEKSDKKFEKKRDFGKKKEFGKWKEFWKKSENFGGKNFGKNSIESPRTEKFDSKIFGEKANNFNEKNFEKSEKFIKISPKNFSKNPHNFEKKNFQKQAVRGGKIFSNGVYWNVNDGGKIETKEEIRRLWKVFITCQAGLESLVKRDNEKIGLKNFEIRDRIVRANATEKQIYEALVWNRFANRVYLELSDEKVETFDELFAVVEAISWWDFLPAGIAIVTEATAIKSTLSHTPSIQSITKKAIVKRLTEGTGTHRLYEDRTGDEAHIQVFIIENVAYILLDITGNALHKRGWRTESGEAPIKETLAAAIVVLSSWNFREKFLDPFCGSGTIAIEAALLARNIAPGIGRHFAIENFKIFDKNIFDEVRRKAREKSFQNGKYQIFASDLDEISLQKAKNNAMRAGVETDIIFEKSDFFQTNFDEKTWIVTNPPYNVRLEIDDENFYKNFAETFKNENIFGGFITSFDNNDILSEKIFKNRKLYNGGLAARFYKKIP